MNQPRILLWVGLLLLVYLNVNAWLKDYAPAVRETPATESKPTSPGASPADGLSTELPSVTSDAPPVAAATDIPVPETAAASPAGPGKVRIVTDVLDIDLSLAGGELIRADLPRYPLHKDDPSTPVRLFNTDSKDTQFVFQSGLTSGKAGRNEPNHMAPFTTGAAEYRLAPGSETLEVPLSWSDGAGLAVTKTFVFRRRSYQVELRYHVVNSGRDAGKACLVFTDSPPFAGQRTFDVGPGDVLVPRPRLFRRRKIQNARNRGRGRAVVFARRHERLDCGAAAPLRRSHRSAKGTSRTNTSCASMTWTTCCARGPGARRAAGRQPGLLGDALRRPEASGSVEKSGPANSSSSPTTECSRSSPSRSSGWILSPIHEFVGNWGRRDHHLTTFLIKLVFYKLAETSGRSMAKMKTVAPRLKAVQERYKDDREGQARAMMELYKREKINPVAGCLPVLVQIPFFLAFYWVLLESVEMRQAPFFGWIQDLSARDPYFILPILMGGAMFFQYKLNPAPPDPVQAKVFAFMPVVMTFMFLWFPAGLVLYWLTNTALSIAQQWKINRVVEAEAKKQRTG